MPFHTNQFGLEKRHWNLKTSSAIVEFPPPYLHTRETEINLSEMSKKFIPYLHIATDNFPDMTLK